MRRRRCLFFADDGLSDGAPMARGDIQRAPAGVRHIRSHSQERRCRVYKISGRYADIDAALIRASKMPSAIIARAMKPPRRLPLMMIRGDAGALRVRAVASCGTMPA